MDIYFDRIKPLFDQSGKSDAELEREIGIPPKTINKWNSGLKSYRKYFVQIAKYFNVNTDYLLGSTNDPHPPSELAKEQKNSPLPDGKELSQAKLAFIEKVKQMDDETVDALNSLADTILARRAK